MKTLIVPALLAGFAATAEAQEIIPFDDHFAPIAVGSSPSRELCNLLYEPAIEGE